MSADGHLTFFFCFLVFCHCIILTKILTHCRRCRLSSSSLASSQGSETDIRAKFYSMAFQLVYDDERELSQWKIVDYEFAGDQAYY